TPMLAAKSDVKQIQPKLALAEPAPVEHLARVAGVSFVERFDANLLHSAVETERADTKLLTRAVLSMLATTVTRGDIAKREQTAARVTKVAMPGGFLPLPVRRPARPNKSVQTDNQSVLGPPVPERNPVFMAFSCILRDHEKGLSARLGKIDRRAGHPLLNLAVTRADSTSE
ncbi:MAG: hypothetical protein ACR2PA_08500, partial [Hyphomicrobiaceae bacterium]